MPRNTVRLDFSEAPLTNRAFSEKPMSFIDEAPKNTLATISELVAIETGNRTARDHWQHKQLQNLLQHAAQRSPFWRERIGTKRIKDISLSDLPVLTRRDVVKQVETEGTLLPSGTIPTAKHATSGSTGTPVQFFISEINGRYNEIRTLAQYFMEGRDLTLNRTVFKPSLPNRTEGGFVVEKATGWLGPLNSLFKSGNYKLIRHSRPNRELLFKELRKDPIGYLAIQPGLVESLFYDGDISFLWKNGTKMFLATGEDADRSLRDKFVAAGIPIRATYSSEEVGPLAAECKDCPENFHVVQSNVIIEVDDSDSVVVGGNRLGRVLVTHLHSYATPFVRYDVGDFATLSEQCGCGHDGPVLSNIYGRKKRLIKHSDGSVSQFTMGAERILKIVKCDEYRIRQTALNTIEVEIAGTDRLSADQMAGLKSLFKQRAGDQFQIRINVIGNIDWGSDIKRLAFRSEVM
jgi:phenylacetate-coenzyme A ligase PaaK-like adenylate-forming protein